MALPPECLRFFAAFIEKAVGIVYADVNFYQLESRLEETAKQLGLEGPLALWEKARRDGLHGTTRLLLLDVATNNETSFFRDPRAFIAIGEVAAQTTVQSRPFRIWSAACSTGQEVYSLAILLTELQARRPFPFTIHATDVSERVLGRAKDGRYSQLEVQRGLSASRLVRWFTEEKSADDGTVTWQVAASLRQLTTFKKLNLLEPWGDLGTFDLILCRNVLIYQTVENKRRVVKNLWERLMPGGCLVLGGAESLIGISDGFEYVNKDGVVLYRKQP